MTIMICLNHPCSEIDVTEAETIDDELALRGQGYLPLEEVRRYPVLREQCQALESAATAVLKEHTQNSASLAALEALLDRINEPVDEARQTAVREMDPIAWLTLPLVADKPAFSPYELDYGDKVIFNHVFIGKIPCTVMGVAGRGGRLYYDLVDEAGGIYRTIEPHELTAVPDEPSQQEEDNVARNQEIGAELKRYRRGGL